MTDGEGAFPASWQGAGRETPSMWPGRTEGVPSMLSVSLSCCGPSTAQPFLPDLDLSTAFPETQQGGCPGTSSLLPAAVLLFLFRCLQMLYLSALQVGTCKELQKVSVHRVS